MELLSSETQSMDNDYAVGRLVQAVSSRLIGKTRLSSASKVTPNPVPITSLRTAPSPWRPALQSTGRAHPQISQHGQHDSSYRTAAGDRPHEPARCLGDSDGYFPGDAGSDTKAVLPRIPADNPLTSKPKNQAGAEWRRNQTARTSRKRKWPTRKF
jgi:hypothetical protein